MDAQPQLTRKEQAMYLFKYLLITNCLQYLEAGAVPAELLNLSNAFDMGHGQQGLLGGIVYIALSVGGPCAGYFLRHFDHRAVIGTSLIINNIFTLLWALTPIEYSFSKVLFIAFRFIMGLSQCVLCVFLPLWINEYSPSGRRTAWMSFLQMSVPLGIMMGYVLASLVMAFSANAIECHGILCWRLPFIIQVMLVAPLTVFLNLTPPQHLRIRVAHKPVDSESRVTIETPSTSAARKWGVWAKQINQKTIQSELSERIATKEFKDRTISTSKESDTPDSIPLLSSRTDIRRTEGIELMPLTDKALLSIEVEDPHDPKKMQMVSPPLSSLSQGSIHSDGAQGIPSAVSGPTLVECSTTASTSSSIVFVADPTNQTAEPDGESLSRQKSASTSPSCRHHTGSEELDRSPYVSVTTVQNDALIENCYSPSSAIHSSSSKKVLFLSGNSWSTTKSSSSAQNESVADLPKSTATYSSQSHTPSRYHTPSSANRSHSAYRFNRPKHSSSDSLSEKKDRKTLRRQCISASLYSGSATKDVLRKSSENLVALDMNDDFIETLPGVQWGEHSRSHRKARAIQMHLFQGTPGRGRTISYDDKAQSCTHDSNVDNEYSDINVMEAADDDILDYAAIDGSPGLEQTYAEDICNHGSEDSNEFTTGIDLDGGDAELVPTILADDFEIEEPAVSSPRVDMHGEVANDRQAERLVFSDIYSSQSTPGGGSSAKTMVRNEGEREPLIKGSDSCGSDANYSRDNAVDSSSRFVSTLRGPPPRTQHSVISYESFKDVIRNKGFSNSIQPLGRRTSRARSLSNCEAVMPGDSIVNDTLANTAFNEIYRGELVNQDVNTVEGIRGKLAVSGPNSISRGSAFVRDTISQTSSDTDSASDEDWEGFTPKRSGYVVQDVEAGNNTNRRVERSLYQRVVSLFQIEVYRYLLGAMAALYFTVTGVQFWGTSYMTVALGAPLPLVHFLFVVCAATGPTAGVFFGGYCIDLVGGYRGAKQRVVALELCSIFGIIACGFAVPITFSDDIYLIICLLWVVLFCGGAVMPACSGIIVSIVPRNHRHISSSIAMIIFNLFGYFMSLVLSGLLMQVFGEYQSECGSVCSLTWGFRLVLLWSFWGLLFLLLSLSASYRIAENRQAAKRDALLFHDEGISRL